MHFYSLTERWRALTPEEKKRYEEMAAEDKVRFQMEMQQYTANQAAAAPPVPPPTDHNYYHDPNATMAYDAYAQHDTHHDPYGQHPGHYHA